MEIPDGSTLLAEKIEIPLTVITGSVMISRSLRKKGDRVAKVALMFALVSLIRLIYYGFKLLFLVVTGKKRTGVVRKLTGTEPEYKGKPDQTMYTFEVAIDDASGASTVTYQELVVGKRLYTVEQGKTYSFYVKDGKAARAGAISQEIGTNALALVACIAIVVVCFWIAGSL